MITKVIDDNSVSVIPEDSDDLLTLRRIVKKGDRIIGDTTRVIKQEKDFSRPDRGERIRIRISIEVEKPSLDNVLDRLRLGGTIVESTNESVPRGSHHSFVVKINDAITIFKKKWSLIEKKLIRSKNQKFGFLLIAIDTGECGIGKLKGTHLQILPNMYSGSSGKRYKTNFNIEKFFEYVALFKTTQRKKKQLKEKIKKTHPYEVPEIAELNVNSINKPYLSWLIESTL